MTDSKTPDWVKEEAVSCTFLLGLEPDRLHVLRSSISQALLSAYERGRTEREWQTIETAPKFGEHLVYQPEIKSGRMTLRERVCLSSQAGCVRETTHWMPLPSPPPAIRHLLEVKG